ncbi:arsenate reductase family protein [Staphylococcus casei]|uniref:Arsenate reductase family protein n=2 Tax=Staphylococcus succinus TaxID=61015 RepID=A0ABX5IK32_9STAP|nr:MULTISPECIES: arsenate reductase family protein [Staphylococcus]MBU0437091.1 arsenate reductase family protein [Staphylococcus succinus]MDH9161724.1 arsenate reductase family protein [Staphylococcus succinus]MEB7462007.1 arsenate reductase family protein [Staphylococcus succinus]MEB8125295.1 arsenate reductase family protein [Staphylococcus succinus]MEB8126027.1 arsenate reductase family protein [Staphylococcus succinus]
MIKFYQYPNCTTCKKAAKFLQAYGVSFEPIDIVQHTPTKSEFKDIIEATDIEINKLFNTHGAKYRELGLKDKLKDLTDDEKLDLLSQNGMLIKRPLAVSGEKVTVGFKEDEYKETWL